MYTTKISNCYGTYRFKNINKCSRCSYLCLKTLLADLIVIVQTYSVYQGKNRCRYEKITCYTNFLFVDSWPNG